MDPPAHCVLHSLRGQSSCRGFGRGFGRGFSRGFAELRTEVHAELLQGFGRAPCTSPPKIHSAEVSQALRLQAAAEFAIATPPRQ